MLSSLLLLALTAAPVNIAATDWCHGGLEEAFASTLETRFYDQVNTYGLKVLSPKDIATVLGVERQKELLGCGSDSTTCLAEIGGALGAEGVMYGCIARGGSGFTATLRVVRTRDASAVASFSERMKNEEQLQDWLDAKAKVLARQVLRALGADAVPMPSQVLSTTALVARAQGDNHYSPPGPHRTFAWTSLGVAAALAAGGAGLGLLANDASHTLLSTPHDAAQSTRLVDQTHSYAIGANVAYGVAGLAAITALVLFFVEPGLYRDAEELGLFAPTGLSAFFAGLR